MTNKTASFGRLFAHYSNDTMHAQWEASGWSVRFGRHLFVLGHYDYRDRRKRSWPRWLRFSVTLRRPAQ